MNEKILVVDDSPLVLRTLEMMLTEQGYEVLRAADGSEAVTVARQHQPDLILLDIHFPPDVGYGGGVAWDGYRLIEWMHQTGASDAPVILITGDDIEAVKDQARAAGAVGLFQKPLNTDALLSSIQRILAQRAARRAQTADAQNETRLLRMDTRS